VSSINGSVWGPGGCESLGTKRKKNTGTKKKEREELWARRVKSEKKGVPPLGLYGLIISVGPETVGRKISQECIECANRYRGTGKVPNMRKRLGGLQAVDGGGKGLLWWGKEKLGEKVEQA